MLNIIHRLEKYTSRHEKWILVIILSIFAIIYSYISIIKHQHYQTFGWDLAFQDQLIWKWSHFKIAYMSMKDNINSLGDHFTLTWILLVPLYWIKSDPKTLLVTQAFSAVFAAFPLYFLSKKILNSSLLSLSISILYITFVSLQHGILNDVHSTLFTPIFITLAYYFIETKRWNEYFLSAIALSLTKEEFGLLVAAIGIVILIKKRTLFPGLISIFYGISIFLFLTIYLMPQLSNTPKYIHSIFGRLGNSFPEATQTVIKRPDLLISSLYDDPLKKDTLFKYFLPFGFLPLLSPVDLIPIAQQLTVRFIDNYHLVRWRADNHYSAPIAALLAISTIYGINNLLWLLRKTRFKDEFTPLLSVLIISLAIGQDLYFHGPINSLFKKQFYERAQWMNDNDRIVNLVPKNARVAANNNLAPHLSQRDVLYYLPEIKNAEYIAVDLMDGPNKYSPSDKKNIFGLISQIKKDPDYKVIARYGSTFLFQRVKYKTNPKLYDQFFRPQPI